MAERLAANAEEPLSFRALLPLLEQGELSSAVYHRRHLLLRIAELAKTSKSHTPSSRARLKRFRAHLESLENNDDVEVEGEAMCEVLMLAMDALP